MIQAASAIRTIPSGPDGDRRIFVAEVFRLAGTVRWRYLTPVVCLAAFASHASGMDAAGKHHLQNASFLESTYLIDVKQGSQLSQAVLEVRSNGFELAGGSPVSFNNWYRTSWTDASVTWMTQVTENMGVIFGGSTGERGKKYAIDPGIKLGMIMQTQAWSNAFLSLRATTILGGRLREKSCTADYGEIGGVQEVNCRLAASTLAPSETLKYLMNEKPYNRNQVDIMLTWKF